MTNKSALVAFHDCDPTQDHSRGADETERKEWARYEPTFLRLARHELEMYG